MVWGSGGGRGGGRIIQWMFGDVGAHGFYNYLIISRICIYFEWKLV
jgi:hypothetical protein